MEDRAVKDKELVLELGLAAAILSLLVGMMALVGSWIFGSSRRGLRHAAGPPPDGQVPDERHQHVATASAR